MVLNDPVRLGKACPSAPSIHWRDGDGPAFYACKRLAQSLRELPGKEEFSMQITPTAFDPIARPAAASGQPTDLALTPVTPGVERPPPRAAATLAPALSGLADRTYLGDYLRSVAADAPKDEDFALIYRGDQLVGRIHNSGAATLFGVESPADWATDTSGRQGPAEAQRRADQFRALGYKTLRADTALSQDAWAPPAATFPREAFEAYVRLRRGEEAEARTQRISA
jgi:hypothetical protein